MTAQQPDLLLYNGEILPLFSNPLEDYWSKRGERPRFIERATCNWRGYIATWEIRSEKLLLIKLEGEALVDSSGRLRMWEKHFMDATIGDQIQARQQPPSLRRTIGVADLFPDCGDAAVAWWFSGQIHVPQGECVHEIDMGYESIHEHDLVFSIEEGRLVKVDSIDSGDQWRKVVAETARAREITRSANPDSEGWLKCPHCGWHFTLRNKNSWDGVRHCSCRGKIQIDS